MRTLNDDNKTADGRVKVPVTGGGRCWCMTLSSATTVFNMFMTVDISKYFDLKFFFLEFKMFYPLFAIHNLEYSTIEDIIVFNQNFYILTKQGCWVTKVYGF